MVVEIPIGTRRGRKKSIGVIHENDVVYAEDDELCGLVDHNGGNEGGTTRR